MLNGRWDRQRFPPLLIEPVYDDWDSVDWVRYWSKVMDGRRTEERLQHIEELARLEVPRATSAPGRTIRRAELMAVLRRIGATTVSDDQPRPQPAPHQSPRPSSPVTARIAAIERAPTMATAEPIAAVAGGRQYRTIQDALDQAPIGLEIEVQPGRHVETLRIHRERTLRGVAGRSETTIAGSGPEVIEVMAPNVRLIDLTIEGSDEVRSWTPAAIRAGQHGLLLKTCDVSCPAGVGVTSVGPIDAASTWFHNTAKHGLVIAKGRSRVVDCQFLSVGGSCLVLVGRAGFLNVTSTRLHSWSGRHIEGERSLIRMVNVQVVGQ